jgi:hypothetical protein
MGAPGSLQGDTRRQQIYAACRHSFPGGARLPETVLGPASVGAIEARDFFPVRSNESENNSHPNESVKASHGQPKADIGHDAVG